MIEEILLKLHNNNNNSENVTRKQKLNKSNHHEHLLLRGQTDIRTNKKEHCNINKQMMMVMMNNTKQIRNA